MGPKPADAQRRRRAGPSTPLPRSSFAMVQIAFLITDTEEMLHGPLLLGHDAHGELRSDVCHKTNV